MAVFPALTGVRLNVERNLNKPEIKSEFDGNYKQTRPMFTRATYDFRIEYPVLTIAQLQTLESFFIANKGGSFSWVSPDDLISRTVRFMDDKLPSRMVDKGKYTVSINLEEV